MRARVKEMAHWRGTPDAARTFEHAIRFRKTLRAMAARLALTACGNRAKVAAHYRRTKRAGEPD